jgi:hypothetical protein
MATAAPLREHLKVLCHVRFGSFWWQNNDQESLQGRCAADGEYAGGGGAPSRGEEPTEQANWTNTAVIAGAVTIKWPKHAQHGSAKLMAIHFQPKDSLLVADTFSATNCDRD